MRACVRSPKKSACTLSGLACPSPQAAKLRGVPVFNAPFSNTRSVAELTIAEVVALARQLGDRSRELHAGTWRKVSRGCHEVRGKTLGIVGYGHIGSQVLQPRPQILLLVVEWG